MRKRIVSLLLALCMLLLSVPVFALSVLADGTAETPLFQTSFNSDEHFPEMPEEPELGKLYDIFTDNDGWDLISYNLDHEDPHVCNMATNEPNDDGFWGYIDAMWDPGMTAFRYAGNENWGDTGSVSNAPDRMGGARWTADRAGIADIILDKIVTVVNSEVAVFVNGVKLFPAGNDWLAVGTEEINSQNTDTSVLNGLFISEGDEIEVLARNATVDDEVTDIWGSRSTSTFFTVSFTVLPQAPTFSVEVDGKNLKVSVTGNGNLTDVEIIGFGVDTVLDAEAKPVLKAYTPEEDVYTVPANGGTKLAYSVSGKLNGHALVLNGMTPLDLDMEYVFVAPTVDFDNDATITYNGGWDFVAYDAANRIGKGNAPISAWSPESETWPYAVISKTSISDTASVDAGVTMWHQYDWGATGKGEGEDRPSAAPACALRAFNGKIVGYRFTTEYAGTVNIDPGELVGKYYGRSWENNSGFAIYVNGKRVWPTDAEVADATNTAVDENGWYVMQHPEAEYEDDACYVPAAELAIARAALSGIKVGRSAQIEFLMIGYGDNPWSNVGNIYKNPSVTYTEADLPKTLATTMSADIDIKTPTVSSIIANSSVNSFDMFKAAHEEITDDAEQRAAYKEYLLTALKVTYNGAWSQGVVKANGSYVKIGYWFAMPDLTLDTTAWDVQWYIAEDQINGRLDSFVAGNKAGIWSDEIGLAKNLHKATTTYVPSSKNTTVYADVFTASATGSAVFSFNKLNAVDANRYAIAIDGEVIWPAGATMDDKTTWYGANSETMTVEAINAALAELAPVKVLRGANVQFCSIRTNGSAGAEMDPVVTMEVFDNMEHVVIYCDGNNNPVEKYTVLDGAPMPTCLFNYLCDGFDINGDGEVDELPETVTEDLRIVPIHDYATPNELYDHLPEIKDGCGTGIKDDWSVIHGHWSADIALGTATWSYTQDGYVTKLVSDDILIATETDDLWDSDGGGLYVYGKFAVRTTESLVGMAAVWTAPKTGRVAIDVKELISNHEVGNGDPAGKCATIFTITLNGKVVWPTVNGGKGFLYEGETEYPAEVSATEDMLEAARAYEPFPVLTVCEGDEIAFIGNQGNDTTWMFNMNPVVSYTALLNAPSLESAAPVLGDTFSLKFAVNGDENADEFGVIVDNVLYTSEDGFAVVDGIVAKGMTDTIKVAPYAKFGDNLLTGAEEEFTFAAVVKALIENTETSEEVKDLGKAVLNYGAAAQIYFNYNTSNLANAGLETVAPAAQHTNVYGLSTELGDDPELALFETVTLIMGDTISLKIVVDNAEADFKLEVADNDEFEDATRYNLAHCAMGSRSAEYKAIIEAISFADLGETLYIRVVDGDGVAMSETLTYSVVTYALRIAAQNEELANAILALADCAIAD